MQYQGGKSRISKHISEVINALSRRKIEDSKSAIESNNGGNRERESNTFVSLFCGSCAVECKITGFAHMILNDNHKYLIALYKGLQNGYQLPDDISEEEYQYVRNHKEDEILAGFVGFSMLQSVEFVCEDYKDVTLPYRCVIYADPPYNNTTGYGNQKFDSEEFWEFARRTSENHLMFISEQTAPDDFVSIWEKPLTRTLDANKSNYFKATERLFIHKKYKYLTEQSA